MIPPRPQWPKPELRLIFQASVPIGNIEDGEALYKRFEKLLLTYSERITLNGSIQKQLEYCCKKETDNGKTTSKH